MNGTMERSGFRRSGPARGAGVAVRLIALAALSAPVGAPGDGESAYAPESATEGAAAAAVAPVAKVKETVQGDTVAVREAAALYNQGRYAEVIGRLQTVVENDPTQIRAWEILGNAYRRNGEWDKAHELWKTLRSVESARPDAHRWLGDLYASSNRLTEAIASYAEARKRDPGNLETRFMSARAERWAGRLDDAIDDLRALSAQVPARFEYRRELAAALFANRQYAEALPLWKEVAGRSDATPQSRIRELAARAYLTGEAATRREAEEFLEAHPENADALRLLADLAQSGNEPAVALTYLRRLVPLTPDVTKRGRIILRMAGIYSDNSERDPAGFPLSGAIELVQEFLREAPGTVDVALMLAELFLQTGQNRESREMYERSLTEHNAQNMRAYRGLMEVALADRDHARAEQAFGRLAAFNPDDPYLFYLRARLEAARPNYAAAFEQLDRLEKAGSQGAVAILLYHGLTESEWLDIPSVRLFREHLDEFKAAGYRFLNARDLPGFFAARPPPPADFLRAPPERCVCVTFDDARRDAMRLGTAVGRDTRIRFSMHVPVGYVEQNHPFIAGWEALRRAAVGGAWDYGSHSLDAHEPRPADAGGMPVHPLANRLWLDAQGRIETEAEFEQRLDSEYGRSRRRLLDEVGRVGDPMYFAYPFGDIGQMAHSNASNAVPINLRTAARYYQVGFVQSHYGHAVKGDNPLLYQRAEPDRHESGRALVDRLLTTHPVFLARRMRAELAALSDKRYLARDMLALLERDGYPAAELARLRAHVEKRISRPLWGGLFGRAPAAEVASPLRLPGEATSSTPSAAPAPDVAPPVAPRAPRAPPAPAPVAPVRAVAPAPSVAEPAVAVPVLPPPPKEAPAAPPAVEEERPSVPARPVASPEIDRRRLFIDDRLRDAR